MSTAAPSLSIENAFEFLQNTNDKNEKRLQFAKEVIHFAFSNYDNNNLTDLASYIAKRFNQNYNEEWNCSIWEWNKGGIFYYSSKRIAVKYKNHKIIIWRN